ncbi:MAG: threonine--tRNA ligase [Firmicutes bacterium]|nr:threonine--tRNA ligase [Bacillota bacterium]
MKLVRLNLPDGRVMECPSGVTVAEAMTEAGMDTRDAAGAMLNGRAVELGRRLAADARLDPIALDSPEGREIHRHTASHVLAQAVKRLFPGARLGIGPATADGFYYDFEVERPFTPDDLERIEKEMRRIVGADYLVTRVEVSRDEALAIFEKRGEPYKLELIAELPEGETISCYEQGEFVDLCAGPHLRSTGAVRAFKLLSVAGAYWRGDERRPMLQRIYGTAYEDEASLALHVERLEEAKRRDHRRLGKEMGLFSIHEEGGPGLIYWHPKGGVVREIIEDFWRREHRRRGYDIVYSPHIAKLDLWKTSGHWDWYRENMYSPMKIDEVEYLLKPMNCPFHILMYKSETRSYRDLPMRWAELGTVYRYERSGVLHGLLRVRGFTQDDAHIFCRPDQLQDEILGVIDLAEFMMRSFGYENYEIMLSVRDPAEKAKYAGDDETWAAAEAALKGALAERGIAYILGEGEAKFYGPAIDITLKDALDRGWQGPTIQVDFNLPERFDMTYAGEDGRLHRPVMIHRTVLGSLERFFGGLIEHYAGALPFWLSPVQVRILPVAERHHGYARLVAARLSASGLRVEVDSRSEKLNYKIRSGELDKIPYMLVVGDKEEASGGVSVRKRGQVDVGVESLEAFEERVKAEARPASHP